MRFWTTSLHGLLIRHHAKDGFGIVGVNLRYEATVVHFVAPWWKPLPYGDPHALQRFQVVMFTHQDVKVWAGLPRILLGGWPASDRWLVCSY